MLANEMPTMTTANYATRTFSLANMAQAQANGFGLNNGLQLVPQKENETMSTRRLVQVFIADPNENVPTEDCLLFRGEQKLTDATDQELFFEIDLKAILEKHNQKRVTFIDKKVKERAENLEPARVRDLKMVVTTVASF